MTHPTRFLPAFLTASALVAGALVFAYALIPGNFSPYGLAKRLADTLVADGDFETFSLPVYARGIGLVRWAGLALFAAGAALYAARRYHRPRLARLLTLGLGAAYLLTLLALGNLGLARRDALVYRLVTQPRQFLPLPKTAPTPTSAPTPTPVLPKIGTWELVVEGLAAPLAAVSAGDGTGRMFIAEQAGVIRILDGGALLPTPFLDLRDRVTADPTGEKGLLGLAFHPVYRENGFFFVNYLDRQGNTVISRFRISAADPNQADPASETPLLGVVQPGARHNGGQLVFGPDGFLYIGLGEGELTDTPKLYAQSLETFLGKILRIDVDHGNPYAIPPDNPFVDRYGLDEIWVYGLRNPWRFSFDSETGDLYIGDVGHKSLEEIDYLPAGVSGVNFGWSFREGPAPFGGADQSVIPPGTQFVDPIWTYPHGKWGCAVIGGLVYRGAAFPQLEGTYLYGDLCSGLVVGLKRSVAGAWERELLFDTHTMIASLGEDENHELYLVDYKGAVYRLVPDE